MSRSGATDVAVGLDPTLRPGLAFAAIHTSGEFDVNVLVADDWDPQSGTAEFKATAIRVERRTRLGGVAAM